MKYVFRVLSSEIKKNYKKTPSGMGYYTLPIINNENIYYKVFNVLIPEYKTFIKNDSLYFVLDDENEINDLKFLAENVASKNIDDNSLLDLLNNDYIYYLFNNQYSLKNHSHAINNFMPVGISVYNPLTNDYSLNKWSDSVRKIAKSFPSDYMSINPLNNNFIYPVEFKKFLDNMYVREYRGNVMMFTLSYDKRYLIQYKPEYKNQYIYYRKDGSTFPVYELLKEEEFFNECERKDKANKTKTPFLKSFNDHGLSKEISSYLNEDSNYQERMQNISNILKEELDLKENEHRVYFIPCIQSNRILEIEEKLKENKELTKEEREFYLQRNNEFLKELVSLYNNDRLFYFSSDELNAINGKYKITSAMKNFIDIVEDEIYYDKENKIVYSLNNYNKKTPLLRVVSNSELKILKDKVYTKWFDTKMNNFKKIR